MSDLGRSRQRRARYSADLASGPGMYPEPRKSAIGSDLPAGGFAFAQAAP
jgi:hypothetical protein